MRRTAAAGYDTDFALWAESQAAALRDGRVDDLDMIHLLEEIDDLSGSIRREIRSRLKQISAHSLKLVALFPPTPTPEFDRTLEAALAGEDFEF